MKAMLYADWMNLRRSMKAILIVVAVIAVASLTWENNASFVSFILVMLSLMVPATLTEPTAGISSVCRCPSPEKTW